MNVFLSTLRLPHNWASYPIIISSAKHSIYTKENVYTCCKNHMTHFVEKYDIFVFLHAKHKLTESEINLSENGRRIVYHHLAKN